MAKKRQMSGGSNAPPPTPRGFRAARGLDCPGAPGVDAHTLWHFVLVEVRYALGRMSTAPHTAADHVRQYRRWFTAEQAEQIRREIDDELQSAARTGRLVGHQCDHDAWVALAQWLAVTT